jgi:hypothetical protein
VLGVHLPALLSRHFAIYGNGKGIIGSAIAGSLSAGTQYPVLRVAPDMATALDLRIRLVDEWAAFLKRRGFDYGLFKFAWFYR